MLGRREPPTAIFCFNDQMAIGVIDIARRQGLRQGTVRLLLEILSDETVAPVAVTLPHKLIVRGSTAPPPEDRAE